MSEIENYVARLLMIDDLSTVLSTLNDSSRMARIVKSEIDQLTELNVEDMQSRYHDRFMDSQ